MEQQPSPPRTTGTQVLLGIFILWQLFFIVSLNFLDLAEHVHEDLSDTTKQTLDRALPGWKNLKDGHFHDLGLVIHKLDRRWAHLTGQAQGWSLFAPNVWRDFDFPAVMLRWEEEPESALGITRPLASLMAAQPLECAVLEAVTNDPARARYLPVTLPSDNEPRDINKFFRTGLYRLRRYESNITVTLEPDSEGGDEAAEQQVTYIRDHLDENDDYIKAYLQWRLKQYRQAHPERPLPAQVILYMRRYRAVPPKEAPPYWRGPTEAKVARWQPAIVWEPEYRDLEAYNPVWNYFEPRKKDDSMP